MLDVFLEALIDSLKVFGIAFIIYFVFSFLHEKMNMLFHKYKKISPLLGASCGLIPECGISVVASDLYQKRRISQGTIMAIFFACSDEALFLLLGDSKKIVYVIPLLCIKLIFGCLLGYMMDWIHPTSNTEEADVEIHCCKEEHHEETKVDRHLIHPLLHCLKIWVYVFIINFIFGILFYYVEEEAIYSFFQAHKSLEPLLAGGIGLIPNCAASVMLSELFIRDALSFGALVTGLSVNAGLGLIYLLKFKEMRKKVAIMVGILLIYSLILGYSIYGIFEVIHWN